jgi:hypothetical protein
VSQDLGAIDRGRVAREADRDRHDCDIVARRDHFGETMLTTGTRLALASILRISRNTEVLPATRNMLGGRDTLCVRA